MDGADSGLPSYYSPHRHRGGGATSSSARNTMFSAALPSSASGASAAYAPPPAEPVRRKRGRPRKYGPPVNSPSRSAAHAISSPHLSMPSSSPTSPSSFARAKESSTASPSASKKAKLATMMGNAGHGFKTHVISVVAGEDVAQKIMSFVQQLEHTFCILGASGSVSKASLLHPAVLGGYVTYEGRFEILSLSGSFVHNRIDRDLRTVGLSVCLSGADGRVVGGGVKGPLVAAEPVQVIAGSFFIDNDGDFSASKLASASAGKLSTSSHGGLALSPATHGSSAEYIGRYGSEINHVIQSPTDWTGRRDGGHGGTSQFLDDDDDNI
ncbi:AT-hook motif nuclear-localized protein 10-like [Canna indica]|uniref:AT-hook motif nuclear-localized protein n=1 Tax=Canna indica TaxID=4628 RepID=A0AAQ3K3R3_9LILI|nr:AT-hook motif nuclear-localized protein 10-like [Canna indica]